ncbi:hypothetical protein X928_03865 [Petrotoga miotherma DSM 10691]|uniref:Chromosome segregation and condensation protein ScpB n=2 Tax=Petrotoga TaxID=28236 RepID=A0A2K1PDZ9_9BACT|nr:MULTISPECIES: SMC-Scp complex subunit ScpB [Petrotoga]PNS01032.1 hypothetical protein X928_03865 [Petrotoga miotherma DSM 10691]POZ93330.1 hypothetical protein AA81_02380 [Petrotoga halophila DSM 16923]
MAKDKIDVEIRMIEALVFSKPNGISFKEISKRLKIKEEELRHYIEEIELHYIGDQHGVELVRNGNKYRFEIKPEIKSMIFPNPRKFELTQTQFEVLAILFMNGDSRVVEIEKIRGKNSYYQLKKLMEYDLVKKSKKKNHTYYHLTEKFYEFLPDKTLKKLEEMKKNEATKGSSNNISE